MSDLLLSLLPEPTNNTRLLKPTPPEQYERLLQHLDRGLFDGLNLVAKEPEGQFNFNQFEHHILLNCPDFARLAAFVRSVDREINTGNVIRVDRLFHPPDVGDSALWYHQIEFEANCHAICPSYNLENRKLCSIYFILTAAQLPRFNSACEGLIRTCAIDSLNDRD